MLAHVFDPVSGWVKIVLLANVEYLLKLGGACIKIIIAPNIDEIPGNEDNVKDSVRRVICVNIKVNITDTVDPVQVVFKCLHPVKNSGGYCPLLCSLIIHGFSLSARVQGPRAGKMK